jgi:hypothetical protein
MRVTPNAPKIERPPERIGASTDTASGAPREPVATLQSELIVKG